MNKHIAHEMQIALCSTQSNKFYNVLIYISNYMIQLNSEYSDTFLDNDSDFCRFGLVLYIYSIKHLIQLNIIHHILYNAVCIELFLSLYHSEE